MSKLAELEAVEYRCAKCTKVIPKFTPHIALHFTFMNGKVVAWQHFCPACSVDPACAVLFSDVLLQAVKEVQIRKWWG